MSLPASKSYTTGHFKLEIDGHKSTAYLKSIEGGWTRANISEDAVGPDQLKIKQISNIDIDPFSIEFGLSGAHELLDWIKNSWNRKYSRRHGQITHANFDLKTCYEHEFYEALITEVTIPALDGTSKDAGYLKCKIQPERVVTRMLSSGPAVTADANPKQKMWTPSAFRFTLDGFDEMQHTSKLDSFTIKQGVKKLFVGGMKFPQIEPTNIQFPNLTGTISLAYASKLLQWHQEYIHSEVASKDPAAVKTGSIEFLTPDRKQTVFRINLFGVGLVSAAIESSTANQDQIKRVKFELYVHEMKLDTGASGFA